MKTVAEITSEIRKVARGWFVNMSCLGTGPTCASMRNWADEIDKAHVEETNRLRAEVNAPRKIYIAHFFTEYTDETEENYSWASAYKTREEAVAAIDAEMSSALDAQGIDDDDETTAEKEISAAWVRGDLTEGHDAILEYGCVVKYCDITEDSI